MHAKHTQVLARVLLVFVFIAVLFAPAKYITSDPFGSLLVSDFILTHHTLQMDAVGAKHLMIYGSNFRLLGDGHYYFYFPLGTSIASLPFVFIAKLMGVNLLYSELPLEIVITAFTSVLILLFLMKIARIFLQPLPAILVSTVFWFGTSFASTCGTALWSHNFAVLFALMTLYLIVKKIAKQGNFRCWPLVSLLLFFSYLCRPPMGLFVPFVLLFIFSYSKKTAIQSAVLFILLFASFVFFSLHEFHQFLPDYYMPQRLGGAHFYQALYNDLFGPSRGLLIYSPFLMLAWLCFKDSTKDFGLKKTWVLLGLGWPLVHLIVIARFHHWWGGFCYGPRLMTDALPGLFLLTVRTWPTQWVHAKHKASIIVLGVASLFAIFVHFCQGMFDNQYTKAFNSKPCIDIYQEYLWDWRYPQWAFTQHMRAARFHDFQNHIVGVTSKKVTFIGWEKAVRWSRLPKINRPQIIFHINKANGYRGDLLLRYNTIEPQKIRLLINNKPVVEWMALSGESAPESLRSAYRFTYTLRTTYSPSLLKNGKNVVTFERIDDPSHTKKLGLMFSYLTIR